MSEKQGKDALTRRQALGAIGAIGAAVVSGLLLHPGRGMMNSSVTDEVYGEPGKRPQLPELAETDYVVAVTIEELRQLAAPNPDFVYFVRDEGREGAFVYRPGDLSTPDNGGTVLASAAGARFIRLTQGELNVRWFGARGDGSTDDTAAFRGALAEAAGKTLLVPAGVYRLTDTIVIPRNTILRGAGNSSWFTFGQRRNELPDSVLDMENGTVLRFEGNASSTYSSNRADMRNLTCAVKMEADGDGIQLHDLKILSSFRIRDGAGQITTQLTDRHALYDVGLWADNATHIKLERISVVGYWQKAGLFIDGTGRLSTAGEFGSVEYATIQDCVFQGKIGLAVLGGDEGNPPDDSGFVPPANDDDLSEGRFGISHLFVSNSFFSGTDHHSNGFADGWQGRIEPDSAAIKIDGFIGSGVPYRINHPRFVNCSIQTRERASIVLDRVNRPSFVHCRAESGPVRASKYTVLPRLINCEFPYNRTNPEYQEIEHCQGAFIMPPMRRLGQIYLQEFEFNIELRNHNGTIQHRIAKPRAIQASARCKDAEALFRYPILEAGWNYQAWTATPIPGNGGADAFERGLFLGEKSFLSKYNLYTCAAFENHPDYQEAEVRVVTSRAADADLWARPVSYSAGAVPYRMKNYSTALKIELRNGEGPATSLATNLPAEDNGPASLILNVKGKFYEQAYGLV